MPKEIKDQCSKIIHIASAAAFAAGAIPIPMSDAIPITAAQIRMIIKLGEVFDVSLSESAAKSLIAAPLAQQAGRSIATNLIKMIPIGGSIIGGSISAATAATITEGIGWIVADDFYRMSNGDAPENIMETAGDLRGAFSGLRFKKK